MHRFSTRTLASGPGLSLAFILLVAAVSPLKARAQTRQTPTPSANAIPAPGPGVGSTPSGEVAGLSAPSLAPSRSIVPSAVEGSNPRTSRPSEPSFEWSARLTTVVDAVATGLMSAGVLGVALFLPSPDVPRWSGPVLLDEATRSAFLLPTLESRATGSAISDAILGTLLVWPLADAAVALGRGGTEVALEMMAINLQSYALTTLVTELFKRLVGRERPRQGACNDRGDCPPNDASENVSFVSGHTSLAATAAGLVCVHHENLPLYGDGLRDRMACYTAIGAAVAVGVLRIASDAHYLSDVLAGAVIGFLSGYVLPDWLRYDIGDTDPDTGAPSVGSVLPNVSPTVAGLSFVRFW